MKNRKNLIWIAVIVIICIVAAVIFLTTGSGSNTEDTGSAETEEATEVRQTDSGTTELSEEQEAILEDIEATYNVENQEAIAQELEEEKSADDYTLDNMLVEYNPFGTNTLSLYVYFNTDEATSVSYTISVDDDSIDDFTQTAYQEETYQTEHELQVIGLVPDMENTITFTVTNEDGTTETSEITYEMGSILGNEEIQLETTVEGDTEELENGLYVVLGNDSTELDFTYYYDNNGVLRSEIPILSYRAHRLLFDDDNIMYYSISETQMAGVNSLGQVVAVYDLGDYQLHHDYAWDDDGNMLILATDTTADSIEDRIVSLNMETGEVTEVLNLENLFGDLKAECVENEDGDLDWMHINTIDWLGDGTVILSSRETSSILKISGIYGTPSVDYIIGESDVWEGTGYESLLLDKVGDFTIQGGQHTVTYLEDDSLEEGQYYLYMYNNNLGVSQTRPDFDWSSIGLTETLAKGSDDAESYYYQYLVDENEGTFELVDSFAVPFSGYASSAQLLGDNTIMDSGIAGIFGEYDSDQNLIASYTMATEKFLFRVYKYDFEGFYFAESE